MSTHQTKDGRWFVKFYLEGFEKRRYFGRGPEAKLAAEDWDEARKKAKLRGGEAVQALETEADDLTFLEITQKYLDARPLSEKHRRDLVWIINSHIADLFGEKQVSKLSMRDLEALDEKLRQADLSIATRNRYKVYCKIILNWGVENDLLPANPFRKFRMDIKRERKAELPPTEDELSRIWTHAVEHLRVTIWAMCHLGLRPGPSELFSIKIEDIDFKRQGVWVTRSKTHSARTLQPVLPGFLDGVREILRQYPDRKYLIEYREQPVKKVKRAWDTAKKKAGITRRLRLYDLRHLYATGMLLDGANPKAVSELMGHATPRMTLEVYQHLTDRQTRAALDHLTIPSVIDLGPASAFLPAPDKDPQSDT